MSNEETNLYKAILSIKDAEECKNFFNDLCTPSELEEFTSRWLIARLLDTKKSYREIASQTGASTTTIGRVARFINSLSPLSLKVLGPMVMSRSTLSRTILSKIFSAIILRSDFHGSIKIPLGVSCLAPCRTGDHDFHVIKFIGYFSVPTS